MKVRFRADFLCPGIEPEDRRELRMEHRESIRPPGWVNPRWAVADTFRYAFGHKASDEVYIVPKGYIFDGASVPWPATAFVPKTHPLYIGATALHDYLYEHMYDRMDRRRADDVFREAMQVLGLNWFWAGLMWRSSRAVGWMMWYRRKPDTLPGRFLALPRVLHLPLGWIGSVVIGLLAIVCIDLLRRGDYRRAAATIADQDGCG